MYIELLWFSYSRTTFEYVDVKPHSGTTILTPINMRTLWYYIAKYSFIEFFSRVFKLIIQYSQESRFY